MLLFICQGFCTRNQNTWSQNACQLLTLPISVPNYFFNNFYLRSGPTSYINLGAIVSKDGLDFLIPRLISFNSAVELFFLSTDRSQFFFKQYIFYATFQREKKRQNKSVPIFFLLYTCTHSILHLHIDEWTI